MRSLFLMIVGISFGSLAAAGVFTVLVAVGLVPRFAGKMHTADRVVLYEEMVIFGTILGSFVSIFPEYSQFGSFLRSHFPESAWWWTAGGNVLQGVFGLFAGMFIGCLALAIAEMLDSVPIFARRISFRHGIGLAVVSMAAGKLCGSLFYFWQELHRVVE
ncbi:MAG: stage V sporulation protein AB [Clostridium sp.]|nr:stage V sporulation protein AB [Acetatifactor muris]MCM1563795.1 stage V sporulation protein AB [Clostridium sp.]